MKKKTTKTKSVKKPAKKTAPKRERAGSTKRYDVYVIGVKTGDEKLAPQPRALATLAKTRGRTFRRDFLAAAAKALNTDQPMGRLLSFHKRALVKGGYIKFERVERKPGMPAGSTTVDPTTAAAPAAPAPASEAPVTPAPTAVESTPAGASSVETTAGAVITGSTGG